MVPKAKLERLVTHEMLSNMMPFYCGWLVDEFDESKPDIPSVTIASSLYSSQIYSMVLPQVWIN